MSSQLYSHLWLEQAVTCKNAEKSPDLKREISPSEAALLCRDPGMQPALGRLVPGATLGAGTHGLMVT